MPVDLNPGDVIRIGQTQLRFFLGAPGSTGAMSPANDRRPLSRRNVSNPVNAHGAGGARTRVPRAGKLEYRAAEDFPVVQVARSPRRINGKVIAQRLAGCDCRAAAVLCHGGRKKLDFSRRGPAARTFDPGTSRRARSGGLEHLRAARRHGNSVSRGRRRSKAVQFTSRLMLSSSGD